MAKPVLGKSVRSDWLFLGRDFAVRTISMETVQAVHFCLGAKPANSKFATKTAKKMWIWSFFKAKLPDSKMDEKDEHSPSEVSVILNIFWCRSWNRHRRKPGDQRRFYQPTEKCKLLNTNKKTATDMNTLLRYIEANGMKMGKLKPYLRPSLTTFCRNLFERTEENRRRIRADDSFQFSAQYKLTALLRRFIRFNISKDNEFEKSWPEKSLQRSESHLFWHEHGKGNKLQAAQAIDEDEALFFNFEFGDPQSSCASKNCMVVFVQHFGLRARELSVKRSVPPLQFLQVQTKHRIHQQVHIPNISWWCENCPEWKEASNCYRQWRTIDFEAMFVNYVQFWIQFSQLQT